MKILNVAKAALYGIFLNYYCWYVLNGAFIPMGTVLFFGTACLAVGLDVLECRRIHVGREFKSWVLYALLALMTSAMVLIDGGDMRYLSDVAKFIQRLLILFMVTYICERENSVRFGLRLMAGTALALAISVLSVTGDVQLKLDITTGAELSANDTGAIMAYGCFAVLFAWGRREKSSLVLSSLKMTGVICCIVVIFLSGSRKSIGAVAILLVVLLGLCLRDYAKGLNLRRLAVTAVVGIAACMIVMGSLLPYAEQTDLYERLLGTGVEAAGASDQIRVNLYVHAVEEFLAHPFFGVGFNQFRQLYGNYTHSTYMEPLACSGLIGLLYLYPYYLMVKKQIWLIRVSPRGSEERLRQKEMFGYLCMALFVAVGIPYMYKDAPCILLGTIIASQTISLRRLQQTDEISADH